MKTLDGKADLVEGLSRLAEADRRLCKVIRVAGKFDHRRRPAGFAGLARIVIGQQVSVSSAAAIWARFEAAFPELDRDAVAAADDDALRAVGLSAPKIKTLRAIAAACARGLDLCALARLPAGEVRQTLTAVSGIGPWTADIYSMFCLGDPDIFPVGDLALRTAVADAFSLPAIVAPDELGEIAKKWAPWRTSAALLFWAYYGAARAQPGLPA